MPRTPTLTERLFDLAAKHEADRELHNELRYVAHKVSELTVAYFELAEDFDHLVKETTP